MTESPQFVGVKSVLLFFVWIVAVVVVFRPLSYLFIALSVAVGAAITEFVAARSNVRVGSSWLTSIVPMALLFAFIASAAIAGMFYLLELVNGITGPAPSYASPSIRAVFLRALLCSFPSALTALFLARRLTTGRAGARPS